MVKAWATLALCITSLVTLSTSNCAEAASKHRHRAAYTLPSGVLNSNDLAAFANEEQSAPHSEYSEPFDDTPIIGRSFRVILHPTIFGPMRTHYDRDTKMLSIRVDRYRPPLMDFLRDDPREVEHFFEIHPGLSGILVNGKATHVGNKLEQNSFGATTRVEEWFAGQTYIAIFDAPVGGENEPAYSADFKLEAADAQAKAGSVTLIIEGTVTSFAPHHAVYCGGHFDEATLSNPIQSSGWRCFVSVAISRAAFEVDGLVLKTF